MDGGGGVKLRTMITNEGENGWWGGVEGRVGEHRILMSKDIGPGPNQF